MRKRRNGSKRAKSEQLECGQLELHFPKWGGAREGAGRPKSKDSGVPHTRRVALASRFPVHVTAKLRKGLRRLRNPNEHKVLRAAFEKGADRNGFRLCHYSIQNDHLHLLCEAQDRVRLSRGLQGLFVRVAQSLNKLWKRKGKIFADRYHDVILETPRQVRNVFVYVFRNNEKHKIHLGRGEIDAFTSAAIFDGFKVGVRVLGEKLNVPVARARTWLLTEGWRRHGLLGADDLPVGAR